MWALEILLMGITLHGQQIQHHSIQDMLLVSRPVDRLSVCGNYLHCRPSIVQQHIAARDEKDASCTFVSAQETLGTCLHCFWLLRDGALWHSSAPSTS